MRKRFAVFDRQDNPLFDLSVDAMDGEGAVRYEKLKGEHKLDITTTQPLQEGLRILSKDGTEKWREWAIDEPEESHEDGYLATYGCTWSMQYDLATVSGGELWPGTYEPITAGAALAMVLAVQSRWEVGNVTVSGTAGTSLYDGQVWDYLGTLQEVWGGEMEPRIVVDASGVVHRYVDWLAHVGNTTASRRFDYGEDCAAIRQKVDPGPRYCWVEPRGGHDATDNDGISYSERVGVEEEPADSGDGWAHDADSKYVRDPDAEADFRQPDGNGGWHYPTKVVIYDSDDPEELLEMAVSDLHNHTRPKTTYEADVLQFAAAGMDPHGVALGDEVQIVDKTFGDAPLRLQARIVEITVNELDETDAQLVIGEANKGIESTFKSMRSAIDAAVERSRRIEGAGTIVYLQHLLDGLNAEINGTGGYSYFVPGEGIITYDRAVADPLIGTEATQVTQMKGGNIRIANEKKPSFSGINDWEWKTVIVSGHIAAELVTAAHITAGYIGDASAGSYWDLDNGILYISNGTTMSDALDDACKVATNYITDGSNGTDFGKTGVSSKVRITNVGMEVFDGNGDSALFAGLSGTNSIVRVGRQSGSGNVIMSSEGYVDVRNASTVMAHFGYADGKNISGGTSTAPYYSIGIRKASGAIGNYSVAEGYNTIAAGFASHAEGGEDTTTITGTIASGKFSHAEGAGTSASAECSHSEGYKTTASGYGSHAEGRSSYAEGIASHAEGDGSTYARGLASHAEGYGTTAYGSHSHAEGEGTYASGNNQHVCGTYNVTSSSHLFIVGKGTSSGTRSNAFYVSSTGNVWCAGSLTQNSDRRLKTHHAYLAEDAADFVRQLKPALFTKDGERHVGFYAQDVQEAEPDEWDTDIVTAQHTDESLDFDPLTLDYQALVAPLVAYAQSLERRIDRQQQTIETLIARIERLEADA